MKTKKMLALAATVAAGAFAAHASTPTVSDVRIEQNGLRTVKVTYNLDADAVVTLDILTNSTDGVWTSIGAKNITHTWGEVHKLVKKTGDGATSEHTCYWAADRSWKEKVGEKFDVKAVVKAWATNAPPDYMVIDILPKAGEIRYYECPEQLPDGGVTSRVYKTDRIVMRKIPAKGVTWVMGSPSREVGRNTDIWDQGLETQHYVTFTNDFYIGVYEVTAGQYDNLCPSHISLRDQVEGDKVLLPMNQDVYKYVGYNDLRGSVENGIDWPSTGMLVGNTFASIASKLGVAVDLPTEAQWEFACRAGTATALYTGKNLTDATTCANLDEISWYSGNSGNARHPVGILKENAFGLYDMLGNVAELTRDRFQVDLGSAAVVEPPGPDSSSYIVVRGGSYNKAASRCRAALRQQWVAPTERHSDIGFRLWAPAVAK